MRARFSDLWLVMRCVFFWMLHGNARHVPNDARSVVVVQFGKLGDMVCTTPMFRAIKAHDSSTRVIVVGDRVGGEVLAGNTDIDKYIVCGSDISVALEELRTERIDAGINVGPSLRGFALLYLSRIPVVVTPRVVGEKSSEGRLYKLVRRLGILVPHRMGHYAPREYLHLLEPLGIISDDTTKHLSYTPEAKEKVLNILQQHTSVLLIGIAPSAGNKLKDWPAERFAAVADSVSKKYGATTVLIGGPSDTQANDAVKTLCSADAKYIDTVGTLAIEELKALTAQLSLFISVDTGPIYIAEAFNIPTIDIVGPMDEREQPPVGPIHIAVAPPFKRIPELSIMSRGKYDVAEARHQAESITVEQVIDAVDILMREIKKTI